MTNAKVRSRDCGCGNGSGRMWFMVLVAAGIFLFVLAGLLLLAGLVFTWMLLARGTVSPAPLPALAPMPMADVMGALGGLAPAAMIIPALFLLLLIAILLIALLFCSCGQPGWLKDLIKMLPQLKAAADALNATADALTEMETGLRAAQVPIKAVGTALGDAGSKVNVTVPVVSWSSKRFDLLDANVVTGVEAHDWKPFEEVKNSLQDASGKLKGDPDGLSAKLGQMADQCRKAAAGLRTIAQIISPS